jgi:molecular chaperone DnaK
MRVGIDFGTTHTVAVVVDRGNYPVVSFDGIDTRPSIIAANEAGELRFGLDAAAVRHEPGAGCDQPDGPADWAHHQRWSRRIVA